MGFYFYFYFFFSCVYVEYYSPGKVNSTCTMIRKFCLPRILGFVQLLVSLSGEKKTNTSKWKFSTCWDLRGSCYWVFYFICTFPGGPQFFVKQVSYTAHCERGYEIEAAIERRPFNAIIGSAGTEDCVCLWLGLGLHHLTRPSNSGLRNRHRNDYTTRNEKHRQDSVICVILAHNYI